MKKLKVKISGMHCASCAGNVERSVRSVKGVKNVSVSAVTNTCFIECEDSTTNADIEKAVAKPGYKVVAIN
ncbi:MAG: heavy metal-associated domain-containing protein [Nanoarchaeota archaeon]